MTPDQFTSYSARLGLAHQLIRQALTADGAYAKQFYLEHIAYQLQVDLSSVMYQPGIAPANSPTSGGAVESLSVL